MARGRQTKTYDIRRWLSTAMDVALANSLLSSCTDISDRTCAPPPPFSKRPSHTHTSKHAPASPASTRARARARGRARAALHAVAGAVPGEGRPFCTQQLHAPWPPALAPLLVWDEVRGRRPQACAHTCRLNSFLSSVRMSTLRSDGASFDPARRMLGSVAASTAAISAINLTGTS